MATDRELLSVLSDNLSVLRDRARLNEEMRAVTVSQVIERITQRPMSESGESTRTCYEEFCRLIPDATGAEKLCFCRAIAPRKGLREPLPERQGAVRVAYIQNPGNDEALTRFRGFLPAIEPHTVSGFSQACEAVLDGKSDTCLLPTVSTSDGRLFRFYEMLERYELSILAACDVDSEEGTKSTRYVLAGRKHVPLRHTQKHTHVLEFSLTDAAGIPFDELFAVARANTAEPIALDSIPLPYNAGLNRFYFTWKLLTDHVEAIQLYLTLQFPDCEIIGSYPILPHGSY